MKGKLKKLKKINEEKKNKTKEAAPDKVSTSTTSLESKALSSILQPPSYINPSKNTGATVKIKRL